MSFRGRDLSIRGLKSVLIVEPITFLIDIRNCKANLHGFLKLLISLVLLDHILYMILILLVFSLMNL